MTNKQRIKRKERAWHLYSVAIPIVGVIAPIFFIYLLIRLTGPHGESGLVFFVLLHFIGRFLLPITTVAGLATGIIGFYKYPSKRLKSIGGIVLNIAALLLCLSITSQSFQAKVNSIEAMLGNSSKQFELSYRYFQGKGVAKDEELGMKWLLTAGRAGNQKAQLMLGNIYAGESSIIRKYRDDESAKNWYEMCIESDARSKEGLLARARLRFLEMRIELEKKRKHTSDSQ